MNLMELYDPTRLGLLTLDALFHAPLNRLDDVRAKDPGVYAHYFVGTHPLYEPARGWPVYLGAADSLRARNLRYRKTLRPVLDIAIEDILVAAIPLPDLGAALHAEQLLTDLLTPVWNQNWLRGYGSKYLGEKRLGQTVAPWSVLHPGRTAGNGPSRLEAGTLARRVEEHLRRTVPPTARTRPMKAIS